MPDLWFVPVVGVDSSRVRLEYVHAAFSRWFDRNRAEHDANDKPYTVSSLTRDERGQVGVQIATLTDDARGRLLQAAVDGATVRLGNQTRPVRLPRHLTGRSWSELAGHGTDRRWQLEFVTPTTFRSGDRSSPMPRVETIMDGLAWTWRRWSDTPLPEPPTLPPTTDGEASGPAVIDVRENPRGAGRWGAVWVSDLDLRSTVVSMRLRQKNGDVRPVTYSGAVGTLVLRCDEPVAAAHAGPLLRLAAYCGVGGMTGKGLGVTRVTAFGDRPAVPATVNGSPGPRDRDGHGSPG